VVGWPVIGVDASRRVLIGDFGGGGSRVRAWGRPVEVHGHEFRDELLGHAVSEGVCGLMAGEGVVAVGVGGEIARFAVSTIIGWWGYLGRGRYRAAAR